MLTPAQTEALVVAVLAVNQYPIEKVRAQLPRLRAARLTDPSWVAAEGEGVVTATLNASGHERGMLTGMMAERLQCLMRAIHAGVLDGLTALVDSGDEASAVRLLCTVKGIGPRVAETAIMLLK
jgi:hypothetical protein